jgi:hypothetical protein
MPFIQSDDSGDGPTCLEFRPSDYTEFHSYAEPVPYSLNGTATTCVLTALSAPRTTVQTLRLHVNSRTSTLRWPRVKHTLNHLASEATFSLEASLNRALAGYDICETAGKVTDAILTISLPSTREVSQMFDRLADAVQALLERAPPQTQYRYDEEIQGAQWLFAQRMGAKVRRSLVEQGICKPSEVVPTRRNLDWQAALNQELVSVLEQLHPLPSADAGVQNRMFRFHRAEFSFRQLMEMKPVWVGDRAGKAWTLDFDTLIVNLECIDGDVREVQEHIQTGFQLPECATSILVEEWHRCRRETRTVEDEWEMLE